MSVRLILSEKWRAGSPSTAEIGPTAEVTMANSFASDSAEQVTREGIQIYGGYGYTTEFDIE
ncbi:acyl-CoA dehydrogenase family protein [Natrialba sp. PRR66]|uniref:acyl-CoA dehydrogenase family protein n=1 Tax=Natrialba sp. PRR66 TaxID=3098146 RepID=UPI002B1DF83C|nr:acyl-CoA dehydrogenase family protein [Natrialba sp. PRR66]